MDGPWQAFERDTARLFLANNYQDVRLVGGSGDKGADILSVKNGKLWVVQCKFTSTSPPPVSALDEVINAARFYNASKLVVAVSRPPSDGFQQRWKRLSKMGVNITVADPTKLLEQIERTPEYPKQSRILRPYQEDASNRFREALLDTGKAQIVMATGLGKTIVMAEVVADLFRDGLIRPSKVLVMAHTNPLVNQLHKSFWYQLPKWVHTNHLAEGEIPIHFDGITFATIQSVISRINDLPQFGLILVDEAHHIGAPTFNKVIDDLEPRMIGGVTATPWRGDGYDINQILGTPVYQIGISDGLRQGFLSDVDYRLLADSLDWKFIQSASRNNYTISHLNRRLIIPTRDEEAVRLVKQIFEDENRTCGIVFSPSIIHAREFAAMLRKYGLRAEPISSRLNSREREIIMAKFKAGQLDFVTTVDLFNEGVDVPDVDMLVFLRVTHSRRIFVQQVGRGLRTSPDKDRTIIVDFVTDIRRIAEVIELEKETYGTGVERLHLRKSMVTFFDASAGDFLREWMLDQASLILREGDPSLDLPQFEYPIPPGAGGIQ